MARTGRAPGTAKTGGRKKGTPNKASVAKAAAISASGKTPLDFMLDVMRDENAEMGVRLDAAKSAANYVHPKLSAIEHSGPEGGPFEVQTSHPMAPPEVAKAIGDMMTEAEAAVGLPTTTE